MKRDAKCRAVNSLVAFASFGPVFTPDQPDLGRSRMPFVHQGLEKFLKRMNQKELLVCCMPCSDTQRP